MFITGVNDAGYKLFTGVNGTGDKFVKPFHGFLVIAGVINTGEQLSLAYTWKGKLSKNSIYKCKALSTKLLTKYEKMYISKFFSFIAAVVDTADKHSFANISANFRKKF
jgi:hypothetical protein